jgi:hypothetical protein
MRYKKGRVRPSSDIEKQIRSIRRNWREKWRPFVEKHGLTFRELKRLKRRYFAHKDGATRCRGIGFELSFEQWIEIWSLSGHLKERGSLKHQYVMARKGDIGPYARGNVKIITAAENLNDQINPRGSRHPRAQLNEEDVRCIRRDYIFRDSKCGGRALAKRYGVTEQVIWKVLNGVSWAHVPFEPSK